MANTGAATRERKTCEPESGALARELRERAPTGEASAGRTATNLRDGAEEAATEWKAKAYLKPNKMPDSGIAKG